MGAKKRRPVYILLTPSEQIALVNALQNFSFSPRRFTTTNSVALARLGSLAEFMALLQIGSVHSKPLFRPQNPAAGSFIPVAECLRRVDSVVNQLDAQVSTYQRAFDQIYSQLERITNTMGHIVAMMERIEQGRNEETRRLYARERGEIRCECGRMVSVENGDEDGQEEKEDKEKADEDG